MKSSKSMRIWSVFSGIIMWTGIYLTGFSNVSWLLYLPAAGFIFAAITGICPSLILISKMPDLKIKKDIKSATPHTTQVSETRTA